MWLHHDWPAPQSLQTVGEAFDEAMVRRITHAHEPATA